MAQPPVDVYHEDFESVPPPPAPQNAVQLNNSTGGPAANSSTYFGSPKWIPSGQQCNTQGNCVADPCANVTCQSGQACSNGQCVADNCTSMGCPVGLLCYQGSCVDDPCRYVSTGDATGCPMGTQCVAGTGACVGGLTNGNGMNGGRPRGKGCELGGGGASRELIAAALLLATAFVLRLRRRRASQGD